MMKLYSVYYRTGGTENFKWHTVGERYESAVAAYQKVEELERAGYRAHYLNTALLEAIGLPETFDT